MNKEIKSIAYTFIFLLIYLWATKGIVKLLFNTDDEYKFDGRVRFINYSLILFTIFYKSAHTVEQGERVGEEPCDHPISKFFCV